MNNVNPMVFWLLGIFVMSGVVLGLVKGYRWWAARRLAAEPLPLAQGDSSSGPTESTSPSSDGAKANGRSGGPVSREQRACDREQRYETGLCLYCDKNATQPLPNIVLLRSAFDWVYRRLNVVPMNRWKVVLDAGLFDEAPPKLVCPNHATIARSHLERHLAETQVDYARFVENQRDELLEYTEYGMDERMLADAIRIRRGKPSKRVEANNTGNVRVLGSAKKAAGE